MERQVGEIFNIVKDMYEVCAWIDDEYYKSKCKGCAFDGTHACRYPKVYNIRGYCDAMLRKDRKHVIFIRANKI